MAWLIEAYLDEGKQGPDHPESLNMKNTGDMRKKREKASDDRWDTNLHAEVRHHRKFTEPEKKYYHNYSGHSNYLSAVDGIDRHNRRHPDAKISGETVVTPLPSLKLNSNK